MTTKKYSNFWMGFIKSFFWIKHLLAWRVSSGEKIVVGMDPIAGCDSDFIMFHDTLNYLKEIGYTSLSQIRNPRLGYGGSYWYSAKDLGLVGTRQLEWEHYISRLEATGISLSNSMDKLIWFGNRRDGQVNAKDAYNTIAYYGNFTVPRWWYERLWKWKIPQKIKCFFWLLLEDALLTWENLVK